MADFFSLTLESVETLTGEIKRFAFTKPVGFQFIAGQYLKLTLPEVVPDERGQTHYFTIAGAPSAGTIDIITKFADRSSAFKQRLADLRPGDKIEAVGAKGDFVLPQTDAPDSPIVLIAGGIGVTPYISMIGQLLATGRRLPLTLMYLANNETELIRRDLWRAAEEQIGLNVFYFLTESPATAECRSGPINEQIIKDLIPDYASTTFYLSGPEPMVEAYEKRLKALGGEKIKTDFFPGYLETYNTVD